MFFVWRQNSICGFSAGKKFIVINNNNEDEAMKIFDTIDKVDGHCDRCGDRWTKVAFYRFARKADVKEFCKDIDEE